MADYGALHAGSCDGDPLVSVVTVVYNGVEFLERAIDSVAAQDYPHIEYIIIDGGSTDGSVDIIRRRGDFITEWVSEPDEGIYDAMNKGIARSSGQLVKLLNADDELTEGSVRAAVQLWQAQPAAVIASELDLIDAAGVFLKRMSRGRFMNPVGPVLHPSWYVPRTVYEAQGLYCPGYRVSADFELFLRLNAAGIPFVHAPDPLARFRSGGISGTRMIGVRERYDISRRYFSRSVALRGLTIQAARKLRARLVLKALGEQRAYALRAWLLQRGRG